MYNSYCHEFMYFDIIRLLIAIEGKHLRLEDSI